MNPDDIRRDQILRYLYERHRTAHGVSSIPIGVRELQAEMKKRHRMTQPEVSHNLDYLIQVGWVREVVREREFTTSRGMRLSREQVKYKISEVGISHLEAATVYTKSLPATNINITTIQGVTVVGDGNIVNVELTDLSRALDDLERSIAESQELTEEQRLEATADLATIRNQIAKKSPDKPIIERAWASLEKVTKLVSLADSAFKVGSLIAQFLS